MTKMINERNFEQFLAEHHITTRDFAEEAGISQSMVSRIITGKAAFASMSHDAATRIAKAVGYHVEGVTTAEMVNKGESEVLKVAETIIEEDRQQDKADLLSDNWMFPLFRVASDLEINLDNAQLDALRDVLSLWARYGKNGSVSFWYSFGKMAEENPMYAKIARTAAQDADNGDYSGLRDVVSRVTQRGIAGNYVLLAGEVYLQTMLADSVKQWARDFALGEMKKPVES